MSAQQTLRPKVSVIGCGNVGVQYAYALCIRGLARQIVMVDIDRGRLEGQVMDLSHGAPYLPPVEVVAGDYPDIAGSDLVVITAGQRQKPGQSRIDLVKSNVELYKKIIPEVVRRAPEAIELVVTNPVDALAFAAHKISEKPASEVLSSGTVLDSARLRHLLASLCRVDPHNVHAYILGEHGDSEFAVWSSAMIGGIPLKDFHPLCAHHGDGNAERDFEKIFREVRGSAHEIIKRKGETSFGIGLALVRITEAILKDENSILPVSTLVDGFLGIRGVYLSLPAVIHKTGVREVLPIRLDETEQRQFINSANALKQAIAQSGL